MFLIGGPAFSGTTLLTHLLNQGPVVCLDEPDFHNVEQKHRGIPLLRALYPECLFPETPRRSLEIVEAVELLEQCQRALQPRRLGMKTCDWTFVEYAGMYHTRGYPVVALIRDIRDAMVSPLPEWVNEDGLNRRYRLIWENRGTFDAWLRYEDLVADPEAAMQNVSRALGVPLRVPAEWAPHSVHPGMVKLDRHQPLISGRILRDRVGIWRGSGVALSGDTLETARLMGYP